jgi:hypothetical protein
MCSRYGLPAHAAVMSLLYGIPFPGDMQPRYNVAPSESLPVINANCSPLSRFGIERSLTQFCQEPLRDE